MPALSGLCLCVGVRAACRATSSTRVLPPPCLSSWPTCGSGWPTCGPATTPTATPEDRGMKSHCPAVDWGWGSGGERHHCCFLPDWTCITFQPREETYVFSTTTSLLSCEHHWFCLSIFCFVTPPPHPPLYWQVGWGGGRYGGHSRLGGASVSPATFELKHRHEAAVPSEPYPTEHVVDLFICRFSRVFFMSFFFLSLSVPSYSDVTLLS